MKRLVFIFIIALLAVTHARSEGLKLPTPSPTQNIASEAVVDPSWGPRLNTVTVLSEKPDWRGASDWSDTQRKLYWASQGLLLADWAQTRHIAMNPHQFHETNPILGQHPSVGKVNAYFAGAMVANHLIADALPSEYRTLFLSGVVAVQLVVVSNNKLLGVKFAF